MNGDLTASTESDEFRARFPERYFALGMGEQNIIGVAAGLAREGFVPFYTTFSAFATRRAFDQVAMSVAFPRLPVRIMGFLPGLTTPGGPTHQSVDDVGLMRLVPNMTILDLADATEIETIWPALDQIDGPVFCRLMRGQVQRIFDAPFQLGRIRVLRDGSEVTVLSSGVATQWVIEATAAVVDAGVDLTHAHVATLKPLDGPAIDELLRGSPRGVVTVENHLVDGGLGSLVAERIAEAGLATRLIRLGLRDTYAQGGTLPYLRARYGLAASDIVRAVMTLAGDDVLQRAEVVARGELHTLAADVAEGL